MRKNSKSLAVFSFLVFGFLYAPIGIVILFAFNRSRYGVAWTGFSCEWFQALLRDAQALAAAHNTVTLAVVSTLVSTLLGTLLGYGLHRYGFPFKRTFSQVLYIPVFIPDILLGVGLLMFFAFLRSWLIWLEPGMLTMILAHVTFQMPFVAIVVRSRLSGLDPALEEAAHDLGANHWQTLAHVTFPLMWPGVLAGAALAFTLSLDDFVVSFFTSGPGSTTLPILIYSSLKRGLTPEINALSTLIIMASVISTLLLAFLQRGRFRSL